MKHCKRYEDLIERYLSGEILIDEKDDLERHLASCGECSTLYRGVSEIDSILHAIPDKEMEPPPFLKTRVMARVMEEKTSRLWAFPLKPVYAIAMAFFAVAIVGVYAFFSRPTIVRMVQLTPSEVERPAHVYSPHFASGNGERVIREVKIFFYYPDARNVSVTGDFNNWDLGGLPLRKTGKKGLWEITLRFKQGVYSYNFIIDGKMIVPDPNSSNQIPDGFGGMNSVLFIGSGETI